MISMVNTNELILFVSRNGMDSNGCGDLINPCYVIRNFHKTFILDQKR